MNKFNELYVEKVASSEITRLLHQLSMMQYPDTLILSMFKDVWKIISPTRCYKDPERLVPLIIYLYFRFQGIPVNTYSLIENSKINESEFYCFIFQIIEFLNNRSEIEPYFTYIYILESEKERDKYYLFVKFLKFFSHCPLCYKKHPKEDIMSYYFNSRSTFKKKLLVLMNRPHINNNKKCTHSGCIFSKNNGCYFGIPCKKCLERE